MPSLDAAPSLRSSTPRPPEPAGLGGRPVGASLLARTENKVWLALFLVLGEGVALALLPAEWSLLRRLIGGVLIGAGSMMSVFMPRMIGGTDFN